MSYCFLSLSDPREEVEEVEEEKLVEESPSSSVSELHSHQKGEESEDSVRSSSAGTFFFSFVSEEVSLRGWGRWGRKTY